MYSVLSFLSIHLVYSVSVVQMYISEFCIYFIISKKRTVLCKHVMLFLSEINEQRNFDYKVIFCLIISGIQNKCVSGNKSYIFLILFASVIIVFFLFLYLLHVESHLTKYVTSFWVTWELTQMPWYIKFKINCISTELFEFWALCLYNAQCLNNLECLATPK